jgi:AraC-like DNA-binding protein
LHSNPAHPWTVGELARHAALSRSAFARRLTELIGVAPLEYLSDWRMALEHTSHRRPPGAVRAKHADRVHRPLRHHREHEVVAAVAVPLADAARVVCAEA